MPGEPKAINEIREAAKRVSNKVQFPIRNFGDLVNAIGGENADFELLGKKHKLGEVRRLIPQDYFPIESEEDFTEKLANLDVLRDDSPLRQEMDPQRLRENEEPRSPDRKAPAEKEHGRPPKRTDGPSRGIGVK